MRVVWQEEGGDARKNGSNKQMTNNKNKERGNQNKKQNKVSQQERERERRKRSCPWPWRPSPHLLPAPPWPPLHLRRWAGGPSSSGGFPPAHVLPPPSLELLLLLLARIAAATTTAGGVQSFLELLSSLSLLPLPCSPPLEDLILPWLMLLLTERRRRTSAPLSVCRPRLHLAASAMANEKNIIH